MENDFKSIKNKSTLWNIMIENGIFNGIDDKYFIEVRTFFEKKINQISTNILPVDSLIILNKQVISEMMSTILKYKGQAQVPSGQAQVQQAGQAGQAQQAVPPLVTSGDITEQRQKIFNQVLEKKQSEFNNLMNKNVPNKIDFADNADKPIGSEMEKILADTIAWREKQLNVVLESQDQTEATKWINKDIQQSTSHLPLASTLPLASAKLLKIGPSTALDSTTIVDLQNNTMNEKKVSFNLNLNQMENSESNNFLKMLNQKSINTNDKNDKIESMLIELLNNQKKILALLETKN